MVLCFGEFVSISVAAIFGFGCSDSRSSHTVGGCGVTGPRRAVVECGGTEPRGESVSGAGRAGRLGAALLCCLMKSSAGLGVGRAASGGLAACAPTRTGPGCSLAGCHSCGEDPQGGRAAFRTPSRDGDGKARTFRKWVVKF